MAEQMQNYKNHGRLFPPFHFFVLPVLLLNALNAIRHVWLNPSWSTAFALLVAVALLTLALTARAMAVTVQDRVIRLEMRMRLGECLPADLRSRIHELATQKDIKLRVKEWQGDFLRA
jgi:hypothetical protein